MRQRGADSKRRCAYIGAGNVEHVANFVADGDGVPTLGNTHLDLKRQRCWVLSHHSYLHFAHFCRQWQREVHEGIKSNGHLVTHRAGDARLKLALEEV